MLLPRKLFAIKKTFSVGPWVPAVLVQWYAIRLAAGPVGISNATLPWDAPHVGKATRATEDSVARSRRAGEGIHCEIEGD